VLKAHVARRPKYPQPLHYADDGMFMVAGKVISRRGRFKPEIVQAEASPGYGSRFIFI
jgi:hypothetical protein